MAIRAARMLRMREDTTIREIDGEECLLRIGALSALLADAVDSGAAVGFLAPMRADAAETFWREVAASLLPERRRLLIAERDGRVLASVQLALANQPNAPHRAEVMKLFVHRDARRTGLGARLMAEIERLMQSTGRHLLVLDTREGDDGERLYRRIGYRAAGIIPDYALSSDRSLHGTVIMYKDLCPNGA
jgi:ribosomal protein S18 acetylase RimI-like enzyme